MMMRLFDHVGVAGRRSLGSLKAGEKGTVRYLDSSKGCHVGKLAAMGITPGTTIEILSSSGGTLMVLVRSSKLCLCRNLAEAIIIE